MKKLILLLLFIPLVSFGQDDSVSSNIEKTFYYEEGGIKEKVIIRNDSNSSIQENYILRFLQHYLINKNYEVKRFYNSGFLKEEGWGESINDGYFKFYRKNGSLISEGLLRKGKLLSIHKSYYKTGQLDYEARFSENGNPVGFYRKYHKNGNVGISYDISNKEVSCWNADNQNEIDCKNLKLFNNFNIEIFNETLKEFRPDFEIREAEKKKIKVEQEKAAKAELIKYCNLDVFPKPDVFPSFPNDKEIIRKIIINELSQRPDWTGFGNSYNQLFDKMKKDEMLMFQKQINFHIMENFRYPEIAQEKKLEGRVFVKFFVETDGSVVICEINSPHKILENEARRIILSLPIFKPAELKGKPIRFSYRIPIIFKLQ